VSHLRNNRTSLTASLILTGLASTGTSVIWNGLPFIAKRDYGFGENENLALYALIGFVYVIGALTSAKCTRFLQPYISLRTIVALLLFAIATVCSLPMFFSGSAFVIWISGGVAGFCSAWLWPIVETYLVAGRHGKEMRRAIGWWNLVWMTAVAGVMLAMAPLMDKHASMVIVGLGFLNLVAIGVLPWYASNPPKHDEAVSNEPVPEGYRGLLQGARVLLPLSYVFNGMLAPLLPFVLAGIAIDIFWQTPIVSIWMISRVTATALMWRLGSDLNIGGWHGRWSVLWGALLAMGAGFVCTLCANALPMLILGLILFGGGMGVTYYAALYYAMAVGQAEVDAAGKHEAFIGSGYMVGPLIGLASLQTASSSFAPIIYAVLLLISLAILVLAAFWRKAR
jgi:MFS family permease